MLTKLTNLRLFPPFSEDELVACRRSNALLGLGDLDRPDLNLAVERPKNTTAA